MLLYADDVVLLADNVGHLQQSLDNLASFCNKWGLAVNMDKLILWLSGMVVF